METTEESITAADAERLRKEYEKLRLDALAEMDKRLREEFGGLQDEQIRGGQ